MNHKFFESCVWSFLDFCSYKVLAFPVLENNDTAVLIYFGAVFDMILPQNLVILKQTDKADKKLVHVEKNSCLHWKRNYQVEERLLEGVPQRSALILVWADTFMYYFWQIQKHFNTILWWHRVIGLLKK